MFRVLYDITCSLRFAYPVGTATMFSQAQSVHASRDLSNAVTFSYLLSYDSHTLSALQLCFRKPSRYMHLEIYHTQSLSVTYLLSMIRIPCRHLHLKVLQAQSVYASKIFSQAHAVGTCISRISNAVTLYLHLFDSHTLCMFRIPCWYCIYINTRLSYQPSHLHLYDRKL